jgi:hypothetical protein
MAKKKQRAPAGTRPKRAAGKGERSTATKSKGRVVSAKPTLLAGGNPQIAKADGDAPVQAYIAAMPGWKRDVGRRLDALIVRTVPNVRKAVRWNSPFYGIEGQGWFLNFHCLTKYIKVAFFSGTSLRPLPPSSPRTRARAISISTRTTTSTRRSWRVGSGRHRSCLQQGRGVLQPAGFRNAGRNLPARTGAPISAVRHFRRSRWELVRTEASSNGPMKKPHFKVELVYGRREERV